MAYGEKYRLDFASNENESFRLSIKSKDYSGAIIELQGSDDPVIYDSPSASDQLQALLGSSLKIALQADPDTDLSELDSEKERQFMAEFKKLENGSYSLLWKGFLLPDGIEQSFTDDIYNVDIDCVDGLGLLKDLAFVDDGGAPFSGRMSALDIIVSSLKRIGTDLNINTSVNIYPEGESTGVNALTRAWYNTERYKKDADSTPMNCEEVLVSVLTTFNACIRQRNGEWFIYRPNELALDFTGVNFYKYNAQGQSLGTVSLDFGVQVGSHINSAPIHHISENQRIRTEKAYKAFRVNYKYGLRSNVLLNGGFSEFVEVPFRPKFWNVFVGAYTEIYRGGFASGFTIDGSANNAHIYNDPIIAFEGDRVKIDIVADVDFALLSSRGLFQNFGVNTHRWQVQAGAKYLQEDMTWGDDAYVFLFKVYEGGSIETARGGQTITLNTAAIPADGNLIIRLFASELQSGLGADHRSSTYRSVSATPILTDDNIKGRFHTVTQNADYSYVPDNKVVYNGDNTGNFFLGTLYNASGGKVFNWTRSYAAESKSILRIMAEDVIRMHQKPSKKFTGDFFGFIPCLSIVQISSIDALFIPGGMQFSFMKNTGNYELLQIRGNEVAGGTEYLPSDDYGDTIKPIIK